MLSMWHVLNQSAQARITNLNEVPTLAPYFFTESLEPEYCHDGASMLQSLMLDPQTYSAYYNISPVARTKCCAVSILSSTIARLGNTEWDAESLHVLLFDEINRLKVQQKFYMMALRHALTGMKVC